MEAPSNLKTAADYVIKLLADEGLIEIEDPEIATFKQALYKNPQDYKNLIFSELGKGKLYKKFVNALDEDPEFLKLLQNCDADSQPIIDLQKLQKMPNTQSILYIADVSVQKWQANIILKQMKQSFTKLIDSSIPKNDEDPGLVLTRLYEPIFDVLIRKTKLSSKLELINFSSIQKEHQFLSKLNISDFLTIFTKLVPSAKLAYFGNLLHVNKLPVPLVVGVKQKKQYKILFDPTVLESVLLEKKAKFLCSLGTKGACQKGKTTLVSEIFGIQKSHFNTADSFFHDKCATMFTNLEGTLQKNECMIIDIHGDYSFILNNPELVVLLSNVSLFLLHIDFKEIDKIDEIVSDIIEHNKDARIIVIIRDCGKIDPLLKPFKLIPLPDLSKSQQSMKQYSYSQIREAIESQLNKVELECKYENFLDEQNKNKVSEEENIMKQIVDIMKEETKNLKLREQCFPNLFADQQFDKIQAHKQRLQSQLKYNDNMKDSTEAYQNYEKVAKKLTQFSNQLQKMQRKPSKLLQIYLQNYPQLNLRHLIVRIAQWKNQHTKILCQDLVDLKVKSERKQGDPEELKGRILKIEEKLEEFDISVDTFIQEVQILYDQLKKNQSERLKNCLTHYYTQLYRSMNPIILVDGKTLTFGSSFLKNFFDEIAKDIPSDKKIYVVSVIGIQSSAKSTLMNYLFNCRFETSTGRCTKGVYFTVAQTEKEAIVVIDTEGLMSVSARDRVFDIQIASFTFLISDLVIINNKGQISAPIRELIGVCTYALKQLHQRKPEKKSKVIFAIRDQPNSGVANQNKMLGDIIRSLKENAELANFQDFLDFNSGDIYPLQSAFSQAKTKISRTTTVPNQIFAEQVLVMRSKILQFLQAKDSNFKDLAEFYKLSEIKWKSIRDCGEHIFNYQEVLEIRIKNEIKKIREILLEKQFEQLEKDYEDCRKKMQNSVDNTLLQQLKEGLKIKTDSAKVNLQEQLTKKAKEIQGVKDIWINDQKRSLRIAFYQRNSLNKQSLYYQYRKNVKKNSFDNFLAKVDEQIKQILKIEGDVNSQKVLANFDSLAQRLLEKELQFEDNTVLIREKIISQIIKHTKLTKAQQIKIRSQGESSAEIFSLFYEENDRPALEHEKKQFADLINLIISQIKTMIVKLNEGKVYDWDLKLQESEEKVQSNSKEIKQTKKLEMKEQASKKIELSNKQIQKVINSSGQKIIEVVDPKFEKFLQLFGRQTEKVLTKLESLVKQLASNFQNLKIQVKREVLLAEFYGYFAEIMPLLLQENRKNEVKEELQVKKQQIEEKRKLIQSLLQIIKQEPTDPNNPSPNSPFSSLSGNILQIFWNNFLKELEKNAKEQIQKTIEENQSQFTVGGTITKALGKTFTQQQDKFNKETYILCYKLIKDFNRFLKQEILFKEQFYVNLRKQIKEKVKQKEKETRTKIEQVATKIQNSATIDEIFLLLEGKDDNFKKQANSANSQYLFLRVKASLVKKFTPEKVKKLFQDKKEEFKLKKPEQEVQQGQKNQDGSLKKRLDQFMESKISELILPKVIGCQERCPFCSMKCKHPDNHQGSHECLPDSHLQQCFRGIKEKKDNERYKGLCYTTDLYRMQYNRKDTGLKDNYLGYLQKNKPKWYGHFEKAHFQNKISQNKCEKIWANIGDLLIDVLYPEMKNTTANQKFQSKQTIVYRKDIEQSWLTPPGQPK